MHHVLFKEKEQIPLKNHMNYNGEQYKCLKKDLLLKDDCTQERMI